MSRPLVETGSGHRLFVGTGGPPVILLTVSGLASPVRGGLMTRLNVQRLRTVAHARGGHRHSTDPGQVDDDALADDLAVRIP